MKLLSVQIALFPVDSISRPDLVNNDINKEMKNIFNAMPTILDLPESTPSEIPIVQAHSLDGKYKLNLSRSRIDFIIGFDIDDSIEPSEAFQSQKTYISDYCKASLSHLEVFRIGVIISMFEKRKDNVYSIYNKYMKMPFSENYSEINVRFNETQRSKGLVINNIMAIEAANLHIERPQGNEDQAGVSILFDINNQPISKAKLTLDKLNCVLECAERHISDEKVKGMI